MDMYSTMDMYSNNNHPQPLMDRLWACGGKKIKSQSNSEAALNPP
jgi:hypothetical protein